CPPGCPDGPERVPVSRPQNAGGGAGFGAKIAIATPTTTNRPSAANGVQAPMGITASMASTAARPSPVKIPPSTAHPQAPRTPSARSTRPSRPSTTAIQNGNVEAGLPVSLNQPLPAHEPPSPRNSPET